MDKANCFLLVVYGHSKTSHQNACLRQLLKTYTNVMLWLV